MRIVVGAVAVLGVGAIDVVVVGNWISLHYLFIYLFDEYDLM